MWFQEGLEITVSPTLGTELDMSLKPGQRDILQIGIKRRGSVPLSWQNCEVEPETSGSHVPCCVEGAHL